MVKTLIGSFLAAALVGTGLVAGRATTPMNVNANANRCTEGRCDATIECKDDGCLIRWTAADGRTGEIELSCKDGECKVVRCDGCGDGAKCDAKPACAPAECQPSCCEPGSATPSGK